jgi:hypothetical protein
MLKFHWLDRFAGKNVEGVVEYLNDLGLGIAWGQKGKLWWIATGEKLLLETDERETAEAFLMGMALSYLALPDEVREQIRERFAT